MSEIETQAQDVIDLRPDEQLDRARVEAYLKGKLEGSEHELHIRQFGGGHANLTYLLEYGDANERIDPHGSGQDHGFRPGATE